ncbi:MAG: hypothetical protein ACRD2B_14155 [Terriglobia bacterium]
MSDYNFLMEIRLSPQQLQALNYISRASAGAGLNLYLVGGAVRDLTSGRGNIRNLNFAAEGNVQKIVKVLEAETSGKAGKRPSPPSPPHAPLPLERCQFDARRNVASLVFAGGIQAEIAGTRREIYPSPGKAPEIAAAGIFEDLRRRDFSANAMAVSLHPNSRGLLLDPTNGAADIESKEFRALHSRSFLEDPSRIYRLLRLSLRLDFKVEARTQVWLESALEAQAGDRMRPDQQGRELRATLQEANPARVLRVFSDRSLLRDLDPGFASGKIPYERLEKIRSTVRSIPDADTFLLYFYGLTEKLSPAYRKRLAAKVMPDSQSRSVALRMEGEARKVAKVLGGAKAKTPSFVYQLLESKPQPLLLFLLVNFPQIKIQTRVKNFLSKFPEVRARLPRAELRSLGVEPGPRFEKSIKEVFLEMLDGKIRTQPQVMKRLRDLAGVKVPEATETAAELTEKAEAPRTKKRMKG